MEDSILISTKKVLGVSSEYDAFDLDILTHINSTLSILNQLGIGPNEGFVVLDETAKWSEYLVDTNILSLIRSYMFLKVRFLFDPPGTGYLIEAYNKQILEYEWRLQTQREWALDPNDPMEGVE